MNCGWRGLPNFRHADRQFIGNALWSQLQLARRTIKRKTPQTSEAATSESNGFELTLAQVGPHFWELARRTKALIQEIMLDVVEVQWLDGQR
jgi:hypothetical protein